MESKKFNFRCQLDDGKTLRMPEYFSVDAPDEAAAWELAEAEARKRCFLFGRVREHTLYIITE